MFGWIMNYTKSFHIILTNTCFVAMPYNCNVWCKWEHPCFYVPLDRHFVIFGTGLESGTNQFTRTEHGHPHNLNLFQIRVQVWRMIQVFKEFHQINVQLLSIILIKPNSTVRYLCVFVFLSVNCNARPHCYVLLLAIALMWLKHVAVRLFQQLLELRKLLKEGNETNVLLMNDNIY